MTYIEYLCKIIRKYSPENLFIQSSYQNLLRMLLN